MFVQFGLKERKLQPRDLAEHRVRVRERREQHFLAQLDLHERNFEARWPSEKQRALIVHVRLDLHQARDRVVLVERNDVSRTLVNRKQVLGRLVRLQNRF